VDYRMSTILIWVIIFGPLIMAYLAIIFRNNIRIRS
jgi:hypothetical protein